MSVLQAYRSALLVGALAAICEGAGFRAGVARAVITPTGPVWAGGYASRDHEVSEKLHDLYAKALALEDERGSRLLFITTDLLGLPRELADPVAEEIARRCQIPRERIVLTSSHTHSGPVLRRSLAHIYPIRPEQLARIDRYADDLHEKLVDVCVRATQELAPARLSWGVGSAGFAVNRRTNREADVVEGYKPKGPVDHDVPVLRVGGADGELRAVLFGYACHCTTMSFYQWCGDYAGFAQADLETAHPGATAMFFAGCGADQNPLPRRKIELCRGYGRQLADAVEEVFTGKMRSVERPMEAAFNRIDVPLDQLPTREALEKEREHGAPSEKGRATFLLGELDRGKSLPTSYPYSVQAVQLGDELTIVALAGEVVVDYSLRLKRELGPRGTWIVAYANDVFAYIPSRRVLAEGGYEGASSMAVYGLPTTWSPRIEEMIVSEVHALTGRVRQAAGAPTTQSAR